jgi:hypothetical protein
VVPAAAFLFFRAARAQGDPVDVDLERLLARVPADLKAGLCADAASGSLPAPITKLEHLERFRSGLREPISPNSHCNFA